MKIDRINRRMFLRGAGTLAVGIPLLPSLLPPRTAAAENINPGTRRFIAIQSYNGQLGRHWYPRYEGGDYQLRSSLFQNPGPCDGMECWSNSQKILDHTTHLHQPLEAGSGYGQAPLQDFIDATGSISDILTARLNPFASKMLLLRSLDVMPDTNHNDGAMLGNYPGASISEYAQQSPQSPTIDQVMAWSERFYPSTPAMRSLHLGPGGNRDLTRGDATCSFTHNGVMGGEVTQVDAHINPRVAWNAIFGLFDPEEGPGSFVNERNRKLVDRVYDDFSRVQGSTRLGAKDRQILDRHMTFLSELEARLGVVGQACARPDESPDIEDRQGVDPAELRLVYEVMVDMIAAAVMCDQTRIATLDMVKAVVPLAGGDLGYRHDFGNPGSWHGDAHDVNPLVGPGEGLNWSSPGPRERLVALNRWIAEDVFGRLVETLDVEESNGATFLDNSVVLWGNELSAGSWHTNYSLPVLLAGGAGGYLKTGRMVDYSDWANQLTTFFFSKDEVSLIRGVPHNRLMVTLMQAMGLRPEDYETNGQPGYGTYALDGKSVEDHLLDYVPEEFGAVLPGLTTS